MSAPISCLAARSGSADAMVRDQRKPVLSAPDYLALLNRCLQAHPMYLEGMAFPAQQAADGGDWHGPPLDTMLRDTRWDHFGVFASVIDEVGQHYELGEQPPGASAVPALACHQRPGAFKAARLRQALR